MLFPWKAKACPKGGRSGFAPSRSTQVSALFQSQREASRILEIGHSIHVSRSHPLGMDFPGKAKHAPASVARGASAPKKRSIQIWAVREPTKRKIGRLARLCPPQHTCARPAPWQPLAKMQPGQNPGGDETHLRDNRQACAMLAAKRILPAQYTGFLSSRL